MKTTFSLRFVPFNGGPALYESMENEHARLTSTIQDVRQYRSLEDAEGPLGLMYPYVADRAERERMRVEVCYYRDAVLDLTADTEWRPRNMAQAYATVPARGVALMARHAAKVRS